VISLTPLARRCAHKRACKRPQLRCRCSSRPQHYSGIIVTLRHRYSLVGDGCLAEAAESCAAACDTFERMRDDQGVGTVKEAQAWCDP
jgi:hypothetical protein